jgi:hypothetical protein
VKLVLSSLLLAGALHAGRARACTPSAERLLAWDGKADLAVVARWSERDRPPPAGSRLRPEVLELRRIGNGASIAVHECGARGPCDHRSAFPDRGAQWTKPGPAMPRLRTTRLFTENVQQYALEARGARGWQRLAWLGFVESSHLEQRSYRVAASAEVGDEVLVAVEYHSRGGNCKRTMVQVSKLRAGDLDDPANPERRKYLLGQVRQDLPLEYWRTVAELGPLPAEHVIEALELADAVGRWAWGARWWREAIAGAPPGVVKSLTAELEKHPNLGATRLQLGM